MDIKDMKDENIFIVVGDIVTNLDDERGSVENVEEDQLEVFNFDSMEVETWDRGTIKEVEK
jgi:hypothetical protein